MSRSDSEISNESVLVFVEENVVRLDVPVDEAVPMRIIESARYLGRNRCSALGWKRAPVVDAVGKGAASQIGHHQKDLISNRAEVGDRADVGMYQLRSGFGLAPKPFPHVGIAGEVRMHHLDHHRAVEGDVEGVVYVRHPAFPNAVHDTVAPAGHVSQCRDGGIGWLRIPVGDYRQNLAASKATRCGSTVP